MGGSLSYGKSAPFVLVHARIIPDCYLAKIFSHKIAQSSYEAGHQQRLLMEVYPVPHNYQEQLSVNTLCNHTLNFVLLIR